MSDLSNLTHGIRALVADRLVWWAYRLDPERWYDVLHTGADNDGVETTP